MKFDIVAVGGAVPLALHAMRRATCAEHIVRGWASEHNAICRIV